jgi:hypothetical protein
MTTSIRGKLINGLLAAGVLVTVAGGGLGVAGKAEARVNGPRNTDAAQRCGWIQDEYDKNAAILHNDPTSAEGKKAAQQMVNLISAWYEQECDKDFGKLYEAPRPLRPGDLTADEAGQQSNPLTQASGPLHSAQGGLQVAP